MQTINVSLTLEQIQTIIEALEFTDSEFSSCNEYKFSDEAKICRHLKSIVEKNN
ncbi:hypothetical protein [Clostridium kluyveri]|uniref:hypothetical protein n=1 Tax=Clostridium kluyveri TaxID=1534 RepID=UPI0022462504|nr:hypothetical protein [Clostridium kluyveri]UZQ49799.1 hypothetical protein OP486_17910 [Clostridium kluyveri]